MPPNLLRRVVRGLAEILLAAEVLDDYAGLSFA